MARTPFQIKKGKILVLYFNTFEFPLRNAISNHLYCFQNYSNYLCYYINVAYGIPKYIEEMEFDLVVLHTILLSKRWLPKIFYSFNKKLFFLRNKKSVKIAIPQDEFIQTTLLDNFLKQIKIDHIFSCAAKSEWKKIYPECFKQKVKFHTVLTGYINEKQNFKVNVNKKRTIDIGYRSWKAEYWLGKHGYLKTAIAEIFQQKSKEYKLKTDISLAENKTLYGQEWIKFLTNCKYLIGVESGASILDKEGKIQDCTNEYLSKHPKASFSEVEKKCFLHLDGNLKLKAIAPRHFEAVQTKACQILTEGVYNGILKPWKHYLPLKKDFSNINKILKIVKEDKLRRRIIKTAYKDIVLSQKYTYKSFTEYILKTSFKNKNKEHPITKSDQANYQKILFKERVQLFYVFLNNFFIKKTLNFLPTSILNKIIKLYK